MSNPIITYEVGVHSINSDNLYLARKSMVDCLCKNDKALATICVQAFNRLEKTKACVESILKNTTNVAYKLLLVDSGSSDGTLEYFKSVPHENTEVLHFTENINACYPQQFFMRHLQGRYYVQVNNDLVVTPRWLSNLIACACSDLRIGMVNPVSSNVSNLQQLNLTFKNSHEMQKAADIYNQHNPLLWHEKLRLITLGTLYTRECLLAIGGLADPGFLHDFSDDDISFRVRRAGYKLILAKDTWIHHNHDFRMLEDKSADGFQQSIAIGQQNFKDKYFGLDSWEDSVNFELNLAALAKARGECMNVLGVDCLCGAPLLEVKNQLKMNGCEQPLLWAFTQQAKYVTDLQTICDGVVACDREEFILQNFPRETFDCFILAKPLNCYHEPYKLLQDLLQLAKPGAQLLCKLTNTFGYLALSHMLGNHNIYNRTMPLQIPVDTLMQWLNEIGFCAGNVSPLQTYQNEADLHEMERAIAILSQHTQVEKDILCAGVPEYLVNVFLQKA